MRTFTCAVFERAEHRPTISLILAADEQRARILARSELRRSYRAICAEIREQGRFIDVVTPA